jgi:hypothetical protein
VVREAAGAVFIGVRYAAGYEPGVDVPADLEAACVELAAWRFDRLRGRRAGRGALASDCERKAGRRGRDEDGWPAGVREMIAPYRRRML